MNKEGLFSKIKSNFCALRDKGAFHVVVSSFLTKFVAFFGSIFFVRVLSKPDYGILGYYENLWGYFLLAVGFGLAYGLQRYIVMADGIEQKSACFSYSIRRGTLYNGVLVVCCAAFALLYPHPAAFADHRWLLVVMAFCLPFLYIQNAGLAAFRALFDHKRYALLSFCVTVAFVAGRVVGAYAGGLWGTVVGRLALEIAGGLICVILVRRIYFKGIPYRMPERQTRRGLNNYSWQMMLTNGLWALFMLNDLFLLGQLSGNEAVIAEYKVAYVIPSGLSILVYAIGVFVAPYFTKHEQEMDFGWVKRRYRTILLVSMSIMACAALVCAVFSKGLIRLLYGEAYLAAVPIMNVLLIASVFNNGIRATTANVLSAMGQQRANLIVAGIGVIAQLTLNCICIPKYGAIGVAWVSVFVHIMMCSALYIVFRRKYHRTSDTGKTC